MIEGKTIYASAQHATLYHSHGVASLNVAHNAEPTPQPQREHEPCSLAHMALSAVRLWHDRHGAGMPPASLMQALILTTSPVRIQESLDQLVRRREMRYMDGCYWPLVPTVVEHPAPVVGEPAPAIPPYLRSKVGTYLHTRRRADPSVTGCGKETRMLIDKWEAYEEVGMQEPCILCHRSSKLVLMPFAQLEVRTC